MNIEVWRKWEVKNWRGHKHVWKFIRTYSDVSHDLAIASKKSFRCYFVNYCPDGFCRGVKTVETVFSFICSMCNEKRFHLDILVCQICWQREHPRSCWYGNNDSRCFFLVRVLTSLCLDFDPNMIRIFTLRRATCNVYAIAGHVIAPNGEMTVERSTKPMWRYTIFAFAMWIFIWPWRNVIVADVICFPNNRAISLSINAAAKTITWRNKHVLKFFSKIQLAHWNCATLQPLVCAIYFSIHYHFM